MAPRSNHTSAMLLQDNEKGREENATSSTNRGTFYSPEQNQVTGKRKRGEKSGSLPLMMRQE